MQLINETSSSALGAQHVETVCLYIWTRQEVLAQKFDFGLEYLHARYLLVGDVTVLRLGVGDDLQAAHFYVLLLANKYYFVFEQLAEEGVRFVNELIAALQVYRQDHAPVLVNVLWQVLHDWLYDELFTQAKGFERISVVLLVF